MARIDFYHLQKQTLDEVLPVLLEKAYATGKKIKVKVGTPERVDFINALLWTYNDESFLPHGSRKDGSADQQPIWISAEDDVPNGATFLFLTDGATIDSDTADRFERVFCVFDGNSPQALQDARVFWKTLKASGNVLHYWQQEAGGSWREK